MQLLQFTGVDISTDLSFFGLTKTGSSAELSETVTNIAFSAFSESGLSKDDSVASYKCITFTFRFLCHSFYNGYKLMSKQLLS